MTKSFYMGFGIRPLNDEPIRPIGTHWYCPYHKHFWNKSCDAWYYTKEMPTTEYYAEIFEHLQSHQ